MCYEYDAFQPYIYLKLRTSVYETRHRVEEQRDYRIKKKIKIITNVFFFFIYGRQTH